MGGRYRRILALTCTRQYAYTLTVVFVDDGECACLKRCLMKKRFQGSAPVSTLQARLSAQKSLGIPVLSLGCERKEPPRQAGDIPASTGGS